MSVYVPEELEEEYLELNKEWPAILYFAQTAMDKYQNKDKNRVKELVKTVSWVLDHHRRVLEFEDKLDMINNNDYINWN